MGQSATVRERSRLAVEPAACVLAAVCLGIVAVVTAQFHVSPAASGALQALAGALAIALSLRCSNSRQTSESANSSALTSERNVRCLDPDSRDRNAGSRLSTTGLPDRDGLLHRIAEDTAASAERRLLAIVELKDFDRLYSFNPTLAGNALACFSSSLGGAVGKQNMLAHIDRGVFAIWFDSRHPDAAKVELDAICYAVGTEISTEGLSLTPEVLTRTSIYPDHASDPDELITRSLIPASDGVSVAEDGVAPVDHARGLYTLEQELRHAIKKGELELYFQPIVHLSSRSIVGAEALVRWNHANGDVISPTLFVPIMEHSDLVDEIGMWILNSACAECRRWREVGLGDLTVAVNLSARQLGNPQLIPAVARTLERYALPAKCLTLELTETAAMRDFERTHTLFGALKELGVLLSIDDFGTGYSSLSYLMKLPFDKLKIDREFVVDVDSRKDRQAICNSIRQLASGLQIGLIAEGAETRAEVDTLQVLGCDLIQGFFFSQPVTAQRFEALSKDQRWVGPLMNPAPDTKDAQPKWRAA